MEISYYFECFSYKAELFDPKCLRIDVLTVEFSFEMPFDDDYKDISSSNSTKLLKNIEPLLKQSFGVMEINLSTTKILKGSVIIVEELRPVRNPVSDIKLLLENDKDACKEFLDETNDLCWNKNTKKIFREKEFEFLGVKIIDEQNVPTKSPTSSTTVVPTGCITIAEEQISARQSPKFFSSSIRSTQSTIKYRSTCQETTFTTSTRLSTTSSTPPSCSIKGGYN